MWLGGGLKNTVYQNGWSSFINTCEFFLELHPVALSHTSEITPHTWRMSWSSCGVHLGHGVEFIHPWVRERVILALSIPIGARWNHREKRAVICKAPHKAGKYHIPDIQISGMKWPHCIYPASSLWATASQESSVAKTYCDEEVDLRQGPLVFLGWPGHLKICFINGFFFLYVHEGFLYICHCFEII